MYGASRLTAHMHMYIHVYTMGVYTSMVGNFTSRNCFKKSLLNSFTFPNTVFKALSQQKQPILLCPLVCLTW